MRLLRPVAPHQRVPALHRLFARGARAARPPRLRQHRPALRMGSDPISLFSKTLAVRRAQNPATTTKGGVMPEVNWIAIVVAALASFLLGGLWYSPVLFGKAWQREAGLTDEQLKNGNMAKIFGLALILCLLAAWMFATFLGPRPSLAFGFGAGFSAGLFWVATKLRHQLSVRAQEPEAVPDQWRLPHAAVHHHRRPALSCTESRALPHESRTQSRPCGQRDLLQGGHRQDAGRVVQGARQTWRRRPRTPRASQWLVDTNTRSKPGGPPPS